MKSRLLLASLLCFGLLACGRQAAGPANPATTESQAPAKAQKARHQLTAEDIARIEAMGKSGLWADVTEVCNKNPRRGSQITLDWNVKGQAEKVMLVLVAENGKERNVGPGQAVGERMTGRWVRPGMTFKLLKAADRAELGSVAITEAPNCH